MFTCTYIPFVWLAFEKSGGEDRGLPWCSSPLGAGREEALIGGSNVRAKITHLLINDTYNTEQKGDEIYFCNHHL